MIYYDTLEYVHNIINIVKINLKDELMMNKNDYLSIDVKKIHRLMLIRTELFYA